MPIPTWMLCRAAAEPGALAVSAAPVVRSGRARRRQVLRKALNGLARLLQEMVANEALARQPGLLQAVDARAKVVAMIGLVVVATLVQRVSTLALAYGLCILLAALSRIPLGRAVRPWLAVPLFSAAIMLPALLNVVTPGRPLLTLWVFSATEFGPWHLPRALTVTDAGVYVAGRFILRTAVCVTLALLLTTTTRSNRLFRGLRALGVPVLFVMLLSMMERYLTVFVRAAEEIHVARISRSIVAGPLRHEQAWVAAGMGSLFRRTHALGSAVYRAMISRGYTGEPHLLEAPPWRLTDWVFLVVAAGFAGVLLIAG